LQKYEQHTANDGKARENAERGDVVCPPWKSQGLKAKEETPKRNREGTQNPRSMCSFQKIRQSGVVSGSMHDSGFWWYTYFKQEKQMRCLPVQGKSFNKLDTYRS